MMNHRKIFHAFARTLWLGCCGALLFAAPGVAYAKGGAGFTLAALSAAQQSESGEPYGLFGIGGQFVNYPIPFLRFGGEVYALAGPEGASAKVGLFGDLVFGHLANADLFLGLGGGVAGGALLGGTVPYFRPEIGALWNLRRVAIEAKLNMLAFGGADEATIPSRFVGINVALLFGDFPIARLRRPRRAPGPAAPPPPRRGPRRPPPPRRH